MSKAMITLVMLSPFEGSKNGPPYSPSTRGLFTGGALNPSGMILKSNPALKHWPIIFSGVGRVFAYLRMGVN